MLKSLSIQNFILIKDIEINFHKGLNIITGETGAGKSILIQALGLLLGNRMISDPWLDKERKCVIEGTFNHLPVQAKQFLKENEMDDDGDLIVRREISQQGKSRIFINDTPVNLNDLKELAIHILDIHAQQDTISKLLSDTFFIEITDRLAGNETLLNRYKEAYIQWKDLTGQLEKMKRMAQASLSEVEYNTFLWNEIQELNPDVEADTGIEDKLRILKNAESIKSTLYNALAILSESEVNITDMLRETYRLISNAASDAGKELEGTLENTDQIIGMTDDLTKQILNFADRISFDEEEYAMLTERMDKISRLLKKHHLKDVMELCALRDELRSKIQAYSNSEELVATLEKQVLEAHQNALKLARDLSSGRQKRFESIEQKITATLRDIGMQYAEVKIDHQILHDNQINVTGIDNIRLLLSPNKGSQFKPLTEVGSGGEKSRLMLAIQDLLAGSVELPTLVLDEIDSGISGEVALKVGALLRRMAIDYQLISITHLPQIAARADRHFFVYKDNSHSKSITEVNILNEEERTREIAQMLGGAKFDQTAVSHAQSLMKN